MSFMSVDNIRDAFDDHLCFALVTCFLKLT